MRGRPAVVAALSGGVLALGLAPVAHASGGEIGEPGAPAVELSALAGIAAPSCGGGTCGGSFDSGAAIAGGLLFRINPRWAFGIAGGASRARWSASFDVPTQAFLISPMTVSSTVTNGLVGASVRFTPVPDLRVSPVIDMTTGVAFQTETRTDVRCNDGVNPGTSLGLGARFRLPPVALLAEGIASAALPFQSCALSDGAPATPYAIVTLGVLVGVTVDLGVRAGRGS
jgi:hypothetical protein